jgi:hypothetical protein
MGPRTAVYVVLDDVRSFSRITGLPYRLSPFPRLACCNRHRVLCVLSKCPALPSAFTPPFTQLAPAVCLTFCSRTPTCAHRCNTRRSRRCAPALGSLMGKVTTTLDAPILLVIAGDCDLLCSRFSDALLCVPLLTPPGLTCSYSAPFLKVGSSFERQWNGAKMESSPLLAACLSLPGMAVGGAVPS